MLPRRLLLLLLLLLLLRLVLLLLLLLVLLLLLPPWLFVVRHESDGSNGWLMLIQTWQQVDQVSKERTILCNSQLEKS